MKDFIDVFKILTLTERKLFLYVLLMIVGLAILETVGIASIMPFLTIIGDDNSNESNSYMVVVYGTLNRYGVTEKADAVMVVGIILLSVIVLTAIYRVISQYVLNRFIETRRQTLSVRLLSSYLSRDYEFFADRHSSDMSKVILSEVDQFVHQALRPLIMMIANIIVSIFILSLLFFVQPVIALAVTTIFTFLYSCIFLLVRFYIGEIGSERLKANNKRFLLASECFGAIKNIKIDSGESYFIDKFSLAAHKFSKAYASQQTLSQSPRFIVEAVAIGSVFASILFMLSNQGEQSLESLIPIVGLYVFAAYKLQPAASAIYQGFANIRYSRSSIQIVMNDLSYGHVQKNGSSTVSKIVGDIIFRNVSFRYKSSNDFVLNSISFEIPKGSVVGIVGSTGSGKSTLVNILLGLLKCTNGSLEVDNIDISRENLRSWQNSVGYVPQDIFLSDLTVAENIAFGFECKDIDMVKVEECARIACINDFIEKELVDGYQTKVGERGGRLSGGQRQKNRYC